MINTAIIGFGLSGRVFHAPFIHTHEEFNLTKVVQRHGDYAKKIYPDVHIVKDYRDLLNDSSIDLIIICTPNICHFEMAMNCLLAGKHIVIEKPFMPTSEEADKIIDLANSKDLKVFVYQNRRWDGDFITIKKLMKTKLLGEVNYFEAHFDRYSPERKQAAWRDEVLPGSGILYDLGSHLIDQVLVLFGKPGSISAIIEKQRPGSKVDDFFEVTLNYPKTTAVATAGMLVKKPELRYHIKGANGTFEKKGIDPQEARLKEGGIPNSKDWGLETDKNWGKVFYNNEGLIFDGTLKTEAGNYMSFYNNVYDVLTNGSEMAVQPTQARDTIRVIELAFESSNKKKEIKF